ncbi:MAG: SDR family NAD(P)-dependent oxidoreductase, partial [Bacillota bacterium]
MKSSAELISLAGRSVMVTGAASGIGYAMAMRFAEAGADLLLVDINQAALNKAVDDVKALGRSAQGLVVDLADRAAIEKLWAAIEKVPDTLINNAGMYPMKDFLEIDESFLTKTLQLNFESAFWMCQHFIRRRLQQGGIIVNVSSVEAFLPF